MKLVSESGKLFGFLLAALVILLAGHPAEAKVNAMVSIPPQQYFAQKVGGELVSVHVMVPPGADAHTYEPKPKQMAELAKAKLYFALGLEFEEAWMPKLKAANKDLIWLRTDKDVPKVAMKGAHDHGHDQAEPKAEAHEHHKAEPKAEAHEHHKAEDHEHHKAEPKAEAHKHHEAGHKAEAHEHLHNGSDPHIWLAPKLVAIQAKAMRDGLVMADPKNQASYDKNLAAFLDELVKLDRELHDSFKELGGHKKVLLFHPAWGYFCRAYGLEQVAIEKEGKKPTAKGLAHLIEQAKHEKAKVILVQPQFSTRSAQTVAKAIGGKVVPIDPLAGDWDQNMRRAAKAMKQAAY